MSTRRRRPGDDLLVLALAQGRTQADAAAFAGVSERTVRRRLLEPEFNRRIRAERDQLVKDTASRLTSLYPKAVDALEQTLDAESGHVRLRAVELVIDLGNALRDRAEIESRLIEVEHGLRSQAAD